MSCDGIPQVEKKRMLSEKRDAEIRSLRRAFVFVKPSYYNIPSLHNTLSNFDLPSITSADRTRSNDMQFNTMYN